MSNTPHEPAEGRTVPVRQLSLFDSTNIIVGIIIGATIYESLPTIAAGVPNIWAFAGIWLLGGLLSWVGALCYVELANMFPEEGGDYVYLTRAFGRRLGFVFAWSQAWVNRPGSIGVMAFVFARYANVLFPLEGRLGVSEQVARVVYAVVSVIALSAVNLLGVQQGKWTQNVLTIAKVVGLAIVFGIGMLYSTPSAGAVSEGGWSGDGFALAMILVLYAYGGWADMAYVGAEIRDPKKNIHRALMLGTVAVMVLYVLVSLAFAHALGFQGLRSASAPAADVAKLGVGAWGERFISVLICVSALGAINGLIFTSSRIYFAMGRDHQWFAWLGQWNERFGTPVRSLVVQAVVTVALIAGFGLTTLRDPFDPTKTISAFTNMVIFTSPVFWAFMVLVGLAVYQLRDTVPNAHRPYRLPFYPFTPFVFAASSLWMCYRAVLWAHLNRSYAAFAAIGLLAAGVIACIYDPPPRKTK